MIRIGPATLFVKRPSELILFYLHHKWSITWRCRLSVHLGQSHEKWLWTHRNNNGLSWALKIFPGAQLRWIAQPNMRL
jgi:hypothetical protein